MAYGNVIIDYDCVYLIMKISRNKVTVNRKKKKKVNVYFAYATGLYYYFTYLI